MSVIFSSDTQITSALAVNRTALETASLTAGTGSVADNAREGLLLRYIADNLSAGTTAEIETTTLDAGEGSIANASRSGLIHRWLADTLNDIYANDLPDLYAEVETTSLDSGEGSVANTSRAGLIMRWLADNLAQTGADSDTLETLSDQIDDCAKTGGDGDTLETLSDQLDIVTTNTALTRAGHTQFKQYAITIAANAAATTMFTVDDQSVLIKSIIIMSNGATTADFTSLNVKAGSSGTENTLIPDSLGTFANLEADSYQVAWTGALVLDDTFVIQVNPTGTGATALDMIATVEYIALVDGGHID